MKIEYKTRSRAELEVIAAGQGMMCIFALDNELLIDSDQEGLTPQAIRLIGLMEDRNIIFYNNMLRLPSTTPGHFHYYIQLIQDTVREERITYQGLLGSDPIREFVNYRFANDPITLFESPANAELVMSWRRK